MIVSPYASVIERVLTNGKGYRVFVRRKGANSIFMEDCATKAAMRRVGARLRRLDDAALDEYCDGIQF